VAGAIVKRRIPEARGPLFGRAFEHFIFTELAAHSSYRELGYDIRYWRTKSGHEVDFILGDGEVALEVKGSSRVDDRELRAVASFRDEYSPKKAIVVCNEGEERKIGNIRLMPWRLFLAALWAGDIID
jgi:predicted AAA+ superfamily ATPase